MAGAKKHRLAGRELLGLRSMPHVPGRCGDEFQENPNLEDWCRVL